MHGCRNAGLGAARMGISDGVYVYQVQGVRKLRVERTKEYKERAREWDGFENTEASRFWSRVASLPIVVRARTRQEMIVWYFHHR